MTTIAVVLTDRYADREVALLMAEGRSFLGFDFVLATPAAGPVTSMGGIAPAPHPSLDGYVAQFGREFSAPVSDQSDGIALR